LLYPDGTEVSRDAVEAASNLTASTLPIYEESRAYGHNFR